MGPKLRHPTVMPDFLMFYSFLFRQAEVASLSFVTTYAITAATRKVIGLEEHSASGFGRDVPPEDELVSVFV